MVDRSAAGQRIEGHPQTNRVGNVSEKPTVTGSRDLYQGTAR